MPEQEIPEAWQLDSGFREDMILTIHASYFAPHADYMEGKQLMLWLIGTDENEEPVEMRMSVGADWQTSDGGVTITHPTKRKQHINKNSIYGHWITFCFEIPELAKVLISRGGETGPVDSRIWQDLVLHLQMKEIKFGRNIEPQDRLMPTEYMGLHVDQQPDTVPPMAPVTATSPKDVIAAARAKAQAEAAPIEDDSPYGRAIEIAKSAKDYNDFVATAFMDAEILADDELAEQVADQENGIWSQAGR